MLCLLFLPLGDSSPSATDLLSVCLIISVSCRPRFPCRAVLQSFLELSVPTSIWSPSEYYLREISGSWATARTQVSLALWFRPSPLGCAFPASVFANRGSRALSKWLSLWSGGHTTQQIRQTSCSNSTSHSRCSSAARSRASACRRWSRWFRRPYPLRPSRAPRTRRNIAARTSRKCRRPGPRAQKCLRSRGSRRSCRCSHLRCHFSRATWPAHVNRWWCRALRPRQSGWQ